RRQSGRDRQHPTNARRQPREVSQRRQRQQHVAERAGMDDERAGHRGCGHAGGPPGRDSTAAPAIGAGVTPRGPSRSASPWPPPPPHQPSSAPATTSATKCALSATREAPTPAATASQSRRRPGAARTSAAATANAVVAWPEGKLWYRESTKHGQWKNSPAPEPAPVGAGGGEPAALSGAA